MPKKKYYPGYASGSFIAKKSKDPDFYRRLQEQGITPTIPGEDSKASQNPIFKVFKGLEFLRNKIKEGLRKRSARKFWEENPIDPTEERTEWIEYGPPYPIPHVPPNERDSINMLREIGRVPPKAAGGGGVASLVPGYQEGGNPDRKDRETYRLDRFMDLVGPRKGMLGRVANKTPQGDPRNPLMKAVLHAASPTLYPSMASPMIVDALADMIPGTMPEGWPGSMYNDADRKVPGMPELRGGRSDQDYLDSIVGSGIGNLISGMVPGGREGYSPGRFGRFLKEKMAGRASGGIVGLQDGGIPQGGAQVTQYNVNPALAQPMANMTDRITTESQRAYQPSPNQRLAGPDAATQTANLAQEQYSMGPGPAGTQQASTTFQDVGTQAQNIGSQMADPMQQSTADLSGYMSQYTKGVTDPQLEQLREFQQVSGQNLGSAAATMGGQGGMRHGVQAAQQARDVSLQAANIIGQGQQQAFQSAQQAFQSDRDAQMRGQQGALQAQQLRQQVGTGQMNLGSRQQQQQRQRFSDLRNIGVGRQQEQQRSLNLQEQDRQNAMNQERQNINWAMNAYNQLPYQSSVTQSAHGAPTTPGQSALATGVAGLGTYNQFQNQYGGQQAAPTQPVGLGYNPNAASQSMTQQFNQGLKPQTGGTQSGSNIFSGVQW